MFGTLLPKTSTRLLLCALATATFFVACGREKNTTKKAVPSQRNGESVPSAAIKWQDLHPRLSADGSKLVFVSGRSDSYRIWKWEKNPEAQTPPTRLATDDLGASESLAEISPDGSWVLVQLTRSAQTDLSLLPFAGGQSVNVTNDKQIETDFAFSPDSKLFVFIRRASPRAGGQIVLGSVGDGSAPTLTALGADTDKIVEVSWIPATSGYSLATATRSESALTWTKRSFAAVEDAASAELTTFAEGIPQASGISVADSSQDKFLTAQAVRPVGQLTGQEIGRETDPARQYVIRSQAISVGLDGTKTVTSPASVLDVRTGSLDSTGAQALLLGKEMVRCALGDTPASRGVLMQVAVDGTNPVRMIPKKTGDSWSVVSDPCDVSGENGALDFGVIDFHWNKSLSAPVIAVVTNFSGDPEVRLLTKDAASGSMVVTEVSANAKPSN